MIIVTGGAGFIGSCIVAALQEAGKKDLVVVDYLGTDEKWKNIAKRELAACIHPDDFDSFLELVVELAKKLDKDMNKFLNQTRFPKFDLRLEMNRV